MGMDPLWHVDGNVKLDRSLHVDGNMKSDGCLHMTMLLISFPQQTIGGKDARADQSFIRSGCVYTLVIVVKTMVSPWTGKLKAPLLKVMAQ